MSGYLGPVGVIANPVNARVPPGGFTKYAAAKLAAIRGTGTCTIGFLGASIAGLGAGGTAASDLLINPYGAIMRQAIINSFGIASIHGDTMLPTMSNVGANGGYNNLVAYSAVPFIFDVTPAGWSALGPLCMMPSWLTQTTNPLVHYIHPSAALGYNARMLRPYLWDFGNQDGGTNGTGRTLSIVETVDSITNNYTLLGDSLMHSSDFTGLSNAANHRLNFGNQGAASIALGLISVSSSPSTSWPSSGFHFCWWGVPGSHSLADWSRQDGTAPKDRVARLIGPSNAAPLFTPNSALTPPWGLDLAIVDLWDDPFYVNNPTASSSTPGFTATGLGVTAYIAQLSRVVQALRRKSTGCDVVFHLPCLPDGVTSDVSVAGNFQNVPAFLAAIKNFAEANDCGWLDTASEWGELGRTGTAGAFLATGNPHPTNLGHTDIANRFASRLNLP